MKCLRAIVATLALSIAYGPALSFADDGGVPAVSAPAEKPAAEAPAPPAKPPLAESYEDAAQLIAKAIGHGQAKNWRALAAVAILLVVFIMRKVVGKYVAWFASDRGGALMAILVGVLATGAEILAAGGGWSWGMLTDGLMAAFTAAGGFAVLKKLISPSDKPAAEKPAEPAPAPPSA